VRLAAKHPEALVTGKTGIASEPVRTDSEEALRLGNGRVGVTHTVQQGEGGRAEPQGQPQGHDPP